MLGVLAGILPSTRYPMIHSQDDLLVLTRVDVGVFLHVRLLVKSLATILARVGTRVRMYQEVSGQRRTALESFATLFAIKGFFAIVDRPERDWHERNGSSTRKTH